MRFKVFKSSPDGMAGGSSDYTTIDDVVKEIYHHKGWPSLADLHADIRKWSLNIQPGDVFCTQVTTIVAVAVSPLRREDDICHHCGYEEGLDYDDLDPVEGGNIEQIVTCPACNERWKDVFVLAEQHALCKKD